MQAITTRSPLPPAVPGPRHVSTDDTPEDTADDTTAPDAPGRYRPAVTYVVITPVGELLTRAADGRVVVDEWGTPYQEALWAAVHAEVDPHHGAVNGIALAEGLRAKIADAAMGEPAAGPDLELYPYNPVATTMLTSLGHPPRRWHGTIAIVTALTDQIRRCM